MGEHNVLHSFSIEFLKCTNFKPWLRWHCKELSSTTDPRVSFSNTCTPSAHPPDPGSRKRTRETVEQEPFALTFISCMDTTTTQIIIFNPFSSSGCLLASDFISSCTARKHFMALGKRGWRDAGMEGCRDGWRWYWWQTAFQTPARKPLEGIRKSCSRRQSQTLQPATGNPGRAGCQPCCTCRAPHSTASLAGKTPCYPAEQLPPPNPAELPGWLY